MAARSKGEGILTSPFLGTGWLNTIKFGSEVGTGLASKANKRKHVGMHCYTYQDDSRCGKARWVAADVGLALVLVHAHVLHQYLCWKCHRGQFYGLPVLCCRSGHVSFGVAGMDR